MKALVSGQWSIVRCRRRHSAYSKGWNFGLLIADFEIEEPGVRIRETGDRKKAVRFICGSGFQPRFSGLIGSNCFNDLNDFNNGQLKTDNGLNDFRTPVVMV